MHVCLWPTTYVHTKFHTCSTSAFLVTAKTPEIKVTLVETLSYFTLCKKCPWNVAEFSKLCYRTSFQDHKLSIAISHPPYTFLVCHVLSTKIRNLKNA
jgi:hypothetical protein